MANNTTFEQNFNSGGVHDFSDFLSCSILEIPEECSAECVLCRNEGNKYVPTSYMCQQCGIYCCIDCYDNHRRERFTQALLAFKETSPGAIKFSKCGKYFKHNETKSSCSENVSFSLSASSVCNAKIGTIQQEVPSLMLRTLDETLPVVRLLQEYGICPQIDFDEENKFKCIYVQDTYMKDFFNFFPHRICLDLVGRVANTSCILYFFVAEDSNGHHEIISLALDAVEDKESLNWILDTFKKHNPSWRKIQMFIVDTLIKHYEIIQNCFPDARILACYYHTNRVFTQFTGENSNSSAPVCFQKSYVLQNLKFVNLACSTIEYNELCDCIQAMHRKVGHFLQKLWNERDVWEIRLEDAGNILSNLNRFLDLIDQKFKPVLCNELDICSMIQKFFFIMKLLRTVHKNNITRKRAVAKPLPYSQFTPQFLIFNLLTNYSAKTVVQQLEKSEEMNLNHEHITHEMLSGAFTFNHLGKIVHTSSVSCSCDFSLVSLPCCHIFAVRKMLSYPVFDISLFGSQWKEEYYMYIYDCLHSTNCEQTPSKMDPNATAELIDSIIPIMDGCSLKVINYRFSILNDIVSAWKDLRIVDIHFEGSEKVDIEKISLVKPDLVIPETANGSKVTEADNLTVTPASKLKKASETALSPLPGLLVDYFGENEWLFGKHLFKQTINLVYLHYVICKTKDTCVNWLQHMGFLPNLMLCPTCGSNMVKKAVNRMLDGFIWMCKKSKGTKKSCAKRCTVRKGTWFEATNMELYQILPLCYMWVYDYSSSQVVFELAISTATYAAWDKIFTRVCLNSLENDKQDISSSSLDSIKSKWLQKNREKDAFITFLQDSAATHQYDNIVL